MGAHQEMDLAERLRMEIEAFASQNDESTGRGWQETISSQLNTEDDEIVGDDDLEISDLLRLEEDECSTEVDDDGKDSDHVDADDSRSTLTGVSAGRSHKELWKKSEFDVFILIL